MPVRVGIGEEVKPQNVYFQLNWENNKWKSCAKEIETFLSLWLFELSLGMEDSVVSGSEDSSNLENHKVIRRVGAWPLKNDLMRWGGEAIEIMLKSHRIMRRITTWTQVTMKTGPVMKTVTSKKAGYPNPLASKEFLGSGILRQPMEKQKSNAHFGQSLFETL
jgi:hypothetical protein